LEAGSVPPSLNFSQLDFVKPSSGFHLVTWERVKEKEERLQRWSNFHSFSHQKLAFSLRMQTKVFNTKNKYWILSSWCHFVYKFGKKRKRAREEKLKAEDKYMWALYDGVKDKVDECICIYFVHTFVVDQWYVNWYRFVQVLKALSLPSMLVSLSHLGAITTFHASLSMPLGCLFL
jgi:hypothetical protein